MLKRSIVKDSFVAISDLHSYSWILNKIKREYLKKYETVYILGDTTDRGPKGDGEGGLELLLEIKKLTEKYPNRVVYIPGNHDEFLYRFLIDENDTNAKQLLEINGGEATAEDADQLVAEYNDIAEDLINWLEELPIQREHYFNGQRYVLAHALFNEKIFKINPKCSLLDTVNEEKHNLKSLYDQILWFRKGDEYDINNLPSSDSIMIIGHTPQDSLEYQNLDLINAQSEHVKVICVDSANKDEGEILSYDGDYDEYIRSLEDENVEVEESVDFDADEGNKEQEAEIGQPKIKINFQAFLRKTFKFFGTQIGKVATSFHEGIKGVNEEILDADYVETSTTSQTEKSNNSKEKIINETQSKFNKEILRLVISSKDMEEAYQKISASIEKEPDMGKIIVQILYLYSVNLNKSHSFFKEMPKIIQDYINSVVLEYIVKQQIAVYEIADVINNMDGYLKNGSTEYIENAAPIIAKLNRDNINELLKNEGYTNIQDYIKSILGNQYTI